MSVPKPEFGRQVKLLERRLRARSCGWPVGQEESGNGKVRQSMEQSGNIGQNSEIGRSEVGVGTPMAGWRGGVDWYRNVLRAKRFTTFRPPRQVRLF